MVFKKKLCRRTWLLSVIMFSWFLFVATSQISLADWKEGLDPMMFLGADPQDPANPTAEEIVKKNWYYWHTEFADDATWQLGPVVYRDVPCAGAVLKINKRGQERGSAALRYRKLYKKEGKGIDYKEILRYMTPEDIRGMTILTWSNTDKTKDDLTWLWIPTLRKVRRVTAAQGEDSAMGSDWTFDDLGLRIPSDDTHKLLRIDTLDDKFIGDVKESLKGFPREELRFNTLLKGNKSEEKRFQGLSLEDLKGRELFVLESVQQLGYLKYDKIVWWIDKETYFQYVNNYYDAKGKLVKVWNQHWQEDPSHRGWWWEGYSDMRNFRTFHGTIVITAPIRFNTGVPDEYFTQEYLARSH